MKWLIVLLLLGSSLAAPINVPLELHSDDDIAKVILAARSHVFVWAGALRNRAVVNALRQAAVESGVRVLILCDAARLEERGNYIPALSKLRERHKPLEVRQLRGVKSSTLVVDDTRFITGPLVAERWTYGLEPTRLILEPSEARQRSQFFWTQWQRGTTWMYPIQNLKFSSK